LQGMAANTQIVTNFARSARLTQGGALCLFQ